jgi:hypothetical protein
LKEVAIAIHRLYSFLYIEQFSEYCFENGHKNMFTNSGFSLCRGHQFIDILTNVHGRAAFERNECEDRLTVSANKVNGQLIDCVKILKAHRKLKELVTLGAANLHPFLD